MTRTSEIAEVQRKGRHRRSPRLDISWCGNELGHPRFGVIVPRHGREEPVDDRRQRWRARLALGAARRADPVVAVSVAVADWLAERGGMARDALHVIHNGIELERFDRSRMGLVFLDERPIL